MLLIGDSAEWNKGVINGSAQNFARILMESPANIMTPTCFANTVKDKLNNCGMRIFLPLEFIINLQIFLFKGTTGEVNVEIFDRSWIESENMNAFLSVTNGSDEEPRFLKITYK